MGTSTENLTTPRSLRIASPDEAFALCEIGDYEAAIDLVPWPPDAESADADVLFVWGVITSQKGAGEQSQGTQEQAKDLLTKACRLLEPDKAELCRVYLALCYWRLGDSADAMALLDAAESAKARFSSLLVRSIIFHQAGQLEKAFAVLNENEFLAASVSEVNQGKFHNQRGVTLRNLADRDNNSELRDRAIVEFEAALFRFENCHAPKLIGAVINNLARLYSLVGNYSRAHEYIDRAVFLAQNDKGLLAQWSDQRANVLLDEGKPELARAESDKALSLLAHGEQLGLVAECYATKERIAQQLSGSCPQVVSMIQTAPHSPEHGGEALHVTPLECVQDILRNSDQSALPLLILMNLIVDPDGDPNKYSAADEAMQHVYVRTPQGEDDYRAYLNSLSGEPQEVGEVSS